jgi:hypothetical protein
MEFCSERELDPCKGASKLTGRGKRANQEAPKCVARAKRIVGGFEVPSGSNLGEGDVGVKIWTAMTIELPGLEED